MGTLSVYLDDTHSWQSTADYMRALQPNWIRIHQPDARKIWRAHTAAPNAKLLLRSWDIDDSNNERKQELYANPVQAARDTLNRWDAKLRDLKYELERNGWGFDEDLWFLGLWNEPDPAHLSQVIAGTAEAMRLSSYPLGVMVSSVGNFGKPGEANSWDAVKPLERAIRDGGHVLVVHEYWQPEGPSFVWTDDEGRTREDAGNLAWRHRHIPLDVPIVIGEAGANGYIYNRHSNEDSAGWRKYMQPAQFAAQVREYIRGCDERVQGVCLYMTDYHSDQWKAFDTTPAHDELLKLRDERPLVPYPHDARRPGRVFVPVVGEGPAVPPQSDTWERSIAWLLAKEGGFQAIPNDKGNYYNGQLIGTKYGISAASWAHAYDIPNLTLDQAKAIYFEHYWQASGANTLEWPLCLLVFDSACLHGVGTALNWLREAGPNPFFFAAKRMEVYLAMDNWHYWGAAWVRRLTDLFTELGKGA